MKEQEYLKKKKFFMQYYHQKVLNVEKILGFLGTNENNFVAKFKSDYLSLISPKNMTYEDAKVLSLLLLGNATNLDNIIQDDPAILVIDIIENHNKFDCLFMLNSRFVDKIRELGYAFDWNGINIQKQIEMGWIKLKEN